MLKPQYVTPEILRKKYLSERVLLKILTESEWSAALAGADIAAPVDLKDGFVHLSTQKQVQETVDKWFSNADILYILAFDAEDFESVLKWEISRKDELFPHIYGQLKAINAKATWQVKSDQNGQCCIPAEILDFTFDEI